MALELADKKYIKVIKNGTNYNLVCVNVVTGGVTYNVWGSGSSVTYIVDTNVAYSEDVTNGNSVLSPTSFTPTKDGYTFVGWRTDKTASSDVLTSLTMGTSPITLYAVFKRTITLSYNGNGSTSGSVSSQTDTQYYNNANVANPSFTLASNGFVKSGYTFSKWAFGSAGGTQYASGTNVELSNNATFYAVWLLAEKILVNNGVINSINCPNASTWHGGYNCASGSGMTENGDYGDYPYYGAYGHTDGFSDPSEQDTFGSTTGAVSTEGLSTLTVSPFVRWWGGSGCGADLYIYGNGSLIAQYGNGAIYTVDGDTGFAIPNTSELAINVSSYSTIEVKMNGVEYDDSDCHYAVGIINAKLT